MIHNKTQIDVLRLASLPGPDTTIKQHALLCSDPRYQAMLFEAARLGWPQAFENDLYQHDISILAAHPDQAMVWILREHGTHLFPLECQTAGEASYARTVIRYWSGEDKLNVIQNPAERPKYYLVKSSGLTEITAKEAAVKIRSLTTTNTQEDHA